MTTSKKQVGLGLIGLGTVGLGVWKLLAQNRSLIEERAGVDLKIRRICIKDRKKKREVPEDLLTTNPDDVLNDPEIGIVLELMGGLEPAGTIVMKALEKGKHVVTANKALLADRAGAIFRKAKEKNVSVGFEASVAGGIPIVKALREGFVANRIQEIYGIINGTSNYILTEMADRGGEFSQVLRQAQKEGYAEQDPSFDVKGIDAAQKLAILISICYGMEPPQTSKTGLFIEGIDLITPLDIEFAKKLGYAIKLLAVSKDHGGTIEFRVHPTMIPLHHPLADVKGVFNAIFLKGDAVGETMFLGRGAGMLPTASAVVSDVVMIALGASPTPRNLIPFESASFLPPEDFSTEYYLRFSVVDKPGVLAQIAEQLGEQDISIASVYQPERAAGSKVPIVVMTHQARERALRDAISKIDNLDAVLDKTVLIRVEHLK